MQAKNIFKFKNACYTTLTISGIYLTTKIEDKNIRMGVTGLLAQVTTDFIFHPFDLVNTRTKYFFKEKINALDMSRRIYNTTGITGFFRGASVTIQGSSFIGFIYFAFYKKFKEFFHKIFSDENDKEKNSNFLVYTFSALAAELIIYPLYYPFELIGTRIQIGKYTYLNFFDGVKTILNKSERKGLRKIKDLYTGFVPCLFLNLSSTFLTFFTFEMMRDYFANKQNIPAEEIKGVQYFLCSFMAGVVKTCTLNFLEVYSIQKISLGKKITFRKFLSVKNIGAMKSGIFIEISSGILHTIFILESINIFGKIYNVNL